MAVLEHLEPGRVFHFFEQMSAIPRGSGNTKAVSDWLAEFARERGLRYQQDALRNRSAVMHIYHSVNRDLFEKSTMRLCEYAVTTYIDTAFPQHQLPEADRKAVIRFIKCQIFGMCIDWISDGMQDEALEELRRISRLCHGLPELIIERSRDDH